MRKVFLTSVLALSVLSATFAQDFYSGMTLWKARTTGMDLSILTGDYKTIDLNLSGEGVFFLSNWFAFTGLVGLDITKVGDADATVGVGVGVGTRFYIPPTGFFLGVGIDGYKYEKSDFIPRIKAETGYTLFVLEHVFLEPSLTVSKEYYTDPGKFSDALRLDVSFGIGVEF